MEDCKALFGYRCESAQFEKHTCFWQCQQISSFTVNDDDLFTFNTIYNNEHRFKIITDEWQHSALHTLLVFWRTTTTYNHHTIHII